MKLLCVVSSLDLTQPFSATPAWWQLLKALYEIGVEIIATPYQGPAIESLWWRSAPNPAKWQGDAFKWARDTFRKLRPPAIDPAPTEARNTEETLADKLIRHAAQTLVAPLWRRHLQRLLTREKDIDAVLFITTPLNQHVGVAGEIARRYGVPVFYYDGDVPASLPILKGFASGFRIYQGADLSEYTAFISNSRGGTTLLQQMGARATHTLWYGVDTDVFAPLTVPQQDIDVFFYGHGREYRGQWIDDMIYHPSRALPQARFAVRGTGLGDIGRATQLPYLSFSKLREYACRSKINLCITRGAHASVEASSSSRPFELAALGSCIVTNPYRGVEAWFEPEREIIIVHSAEEAIERYRHLLAHDAERRAIGEAARARVYKQHTMRHRAQELRAIIGQYC